MPRTSRTQRTLAAISSSNGNFELIELRQLDQNGEYADVIVVDCIHSGVASRNTVGIKNRERLALVFPLDEAKIPEVRALRSGFPRTMHQNPVPLGKPASLCLYSEKWESLEHKWTPQLHLHQILTWLKDTSERVLHREDQAVEPFYFDSLSWIILPPDYDVKLLDNDQCLVLCLVSKGKDRSEVFEAHFVSTSHAEEKSFDPYIPIRINAPAVVHGEPLMRADTLGEMDQQFAQKDTKLFPLICAAIKERVTRTGIGRNIENRVVFLLDIPIKRSADDEHPERIQHVAFLSSCDITIIGEAAGILCQNGQLDEKGKTVDNKYYCAQIIAQVGTTYPEDWKRLGIYQIGLRYRNTPSFARKVSGLSEETATFHGIMAGTGALGGSLAELWGRAGWGNWGLVDPDRVEPHNIIRHITNDSEVGLYKVDAVKAHIETVYYPGTITVETIPHSITDFDKPAVKQALEKADLLIDATTSISAPRKLSCSTIVPRSVSVFLTPSGNGAVILAEDAKQTIRLDLLEAQYYRAIINSDWGIQHLIGHSGHIAVGGGCRDVSFVMSFETIQMFAGLLAKHIREIKDHPNAAIRIWNINSETGSLDATIAQPSNALVCTSNGWDVVMDTDTRTKLRQMRSDKLPNETGGILVGYVDHKIRKIFIVDACLAPDDSDGDPSGFTRGVRGLLDMVADIRNRTANIVGYIGEWHSHPPRTSARSSQADDALLEHLAGVLGEEGQPALMVIVADDGFQIIVGEAE